MDSQTIMQILEVVGRMAGIGGLSLGVLLLVFRAVISKNIFPTLTQKQAYRILNKIIILVTIVSIVGMGTWLMSEIVKSPAQDLRPTSNLNEVYPVIDLKRPVEEQVQLFPTDKVTIYADPDFLQEVWFGEIWEPYIPDKEYIVWGIPGQPVTPRFRFEGRGRVKMRIKLSVQHNEDLERPRDIR